MYTLQHKQYTQYENICIAIFFTQTTKITLNRIKLFKRLITFPSERKGVHIDTRIPFYSVANHRPDVIIVF